MLNEFKSCLHAFSIELDKLPVLRLVQKTCRLNLVQMQSEFGEKRKQSARRVSSVGKKYLIA